MSLQLAARHLAQQGRGNDSALVHIAPKELESLQALAQRNGGSLSINPQTGLPEAGFLESLLPAVIGGGLSVASGGAIDPMTAAMLVGGGQAMMTGDLNKGLMAGIGAYGGAGMGSYMANAGSVVPAAAKDTVVQQTAAEIAPVSVPVEAAPAPATTYAPTGFKFSNAGLGGNSNTSAAVQDALANSRMPAMQTNSAVEGYLQNNRSMMPLSTPTPTPAISNVPEFLTPRQLGSFPGGSTDPTVMNTAKDFDAFKRGFTGENALSFMKANPMQAAALASGPLMEATTSTPPKPAVDSDKGANANAGIKYRPNFVNPLPAPNRYGIEQVYNRPSYMAGGGQVEHYVAGGLTPALRTYQQLQQQRAGRGSQIDAKQQFDEYMKSVRGGTVRPTLPPVTTPTPAPIAPTQPIETSNQGGGGGRGGRGQGGDEGTPGEGFNPTSEGAYNVSRFGQAIFPISPFLGGIAGAYGNYLAKNVDPNYSHEGRNYTAPLGSRDVTDTDPYANFDYKTPAQEAAEAAKLAEAAEQAKQYTDPFTGDYKAPMANYPVAGDSLVAGVLTPSEPTQGAYLPESVTSDPFAPSESTPAPEALSRQEKDIPTAESNPYSLGYVGKDLTTGLAIGDPRENTSTFNNALLTTNQVFGINEGYQQFRNKYTPGTDFTDENAAQLFGLDSTDYEKQVSDLDKYQLGSLTPDALNYAGTGVPNTLNPVAVDAAPAPEAAPAPDVDPYAAETAATTAAQIDRINALMAAEREADAAAQAAAETAAADADMASQDAKERKQSDRLQALDSFNNISLGASTMPTGTDLTGTSSSLLGTGVSTPNGPDISSPQGVGAAPSDGGAPPSGGGGGGGGGGYSGAPSDSGSYSGSFGNVQAPGEAGRGSAPSVSTTPSMGEGASPSDGGAPPSGGGGGGGGGGRVICTHFYRKGEMSREMWRSDLEFTFKNLSPTTVRGYQYWAIPYVKLMRKSKLAENIMRPLAMHRAQELAYKMGRSPKGSLFGKVVRLIGEPICFTVGLFVGEQNWQSLWTPAKD